jgi:hypothetical protein
MNEARKNGVGNNTSCEVLVANHATLLLDPADWPARRAACLQHLFVSQSSRRAA